MPEVDATTHYSENLPHVGTVDVVIACGVTHWAVVSDRLGQVTCAACRTAAGYLVEEPPTRSVVAVDWGGPYQEVWVSNHSNIGNWYTPDVPLSFACGEIHPHWYDVLRRAEGRTLTLLVAGDADAFMTGYDAGVSATAAAIEDAVDDARTKGRKGQH